jgi:hypothetical protein
VDLFVAVLQPDFYRPRLDSSQTAMTPVVQCGKVSASMAADSNEAAELLKPGKHKIYQRGTKYTNILHHTNMQDPPKCTKIWIFGLKI